METTHPTKSTIPYHWTPVLDALCGPRGLGERLTFLYVMTGAFPIDDEGRRIEPKAATETTKWLAIWPVEATNKLSGADRSSSTMLRKKLKASRLATCRTSYDHSRRISEVWDVTRIVSLTPLRAELMALQVASALAKTPIAKRDHRTKAKRAADAAAAKAKAKKPFDFTDDEVAGLWALTRLADGSQETRMAA